MNADNRTKLPRGWRSPAETGSSGARVPDQGGQGFTLLELLVVVGTAGLLAAMVFSARASGGADAQALVCLNNLRQLQLAWRMYADDNGERIVRSADIVNTASTLTDFVNLGNGAWCHGRMDLDANGSSTNTGLIAAGSLFSYVRSPQVYKCPADKKVTTTGAPTVRSVSVNCWLGPINSWNTANAGSGYFSGNSGRNIYSLSDLDTNPPAKTFVLMDEDARSINDGWFVVNVAQPPNVPGLLWVDLPSTAHGGAGTLSFGDGHVELRKWTDPYLYRSPLVRPGAFTGPDLLWLSVRATSPQ